MRRTLRILSRRSVPRRAAPFAPGVASRGRRPCLVTGGAHAALTRPSRGRARPLRTEARAVFSGARRESRALRRAGLPSGARRESLLPSRPSGRGSERRFLTYRHPWGSGWILSVRRLYLLGKGLLTGTLGCRGVPGLGVRVAVP